MIVLVTHNDGGVGKTSVAVHIIGVLLGESINKKILLIDCDDQHNAWDFFVPYRPTKVKEFWRSENLSILFNESRESVSDVIDVKEYDHIVIDMDTPRKNTMRVMIDNDPDVVLIPLNKSQGSKSLGNLDETLSIIFELESTMGISPVTIIVPLGLKKSLIEERLKSIDEKPEKLFLAPKIRNVEDRMQIAVYEDHKYIWDYDGYTNLYEVFRSLIGV